MRYTKLIFALVLAMFLVTALASCSLMEDDTVYAVVSTDNISDGFYYDLYENGDAVITSAQIEPKHLVIPDEISGHRVVGIGEAAFSGKSQILTLSIGDNVKTISDEAFRDCTRLVIVKLGKSVKSIGSQAFGNCELLCEIEGSHSLEAIGDFAFNNCVSLVKMSFPATLKTIGDAAFEGCSALCEVQLPQGVEGIGVSAFSSCHALASADLGGLSEITEAAFEKCTSLTSITLSKAVKRVGERAFRGCTSLTAVSIDRGVEIIENSAFVETPWLDSNNEEFLIVGNGILIKYGGSAANVEIPSGVKRISDAFAGSNTLRSVSAKGVKAIESGAFAGCEGLARVTFYEGLETIGDRAFSSCSSLSVVYLPKSIKTIGKNAFYKCTGLTEANYAGSSGNWNSVSVVKKGNETLTNAVRYGIKP